MRAVAQATAFFRLRSAQRARHSITYTAYADLPGEPIEAMPEALLLFDLDAHAAHGVTLVAPQAPLVATVAAVAAPAVGHRLSLGGRALSSNWKGRALDNLAAIRVAREICATPGRVATAAETEVLERYVGFGATELAQALFPIPGDPIRRGWEDIASELCALVDERDRTYMARSTQYAHYTPDFLTRAMWDTVRSLGFQCGTVLEPGCGIGLFIAAAPAEIAGELKWIGVEMDPTTATVAQALHPRADIRLEDFAKARLREPIDLVIGNPPFAKTHVTGEGPAGKKGLRLHDYFIARSLELLSPGGLGAFVTSAGTMDKADPKGRAYIASLAAFLGGVRLPQGSMAEQAGTEVVVDILFFRRTEAQAEEVPAWTEIREVEATSGFGDRPMRINRYFAEHPEMVLGRHAWVTSPFGPKYSCLADSDVDVERALRQALNRLPGARLGSTEPVPADTRIEDARDALAATPILTTSTVPSSLFDLSEPGLLAPIAPPARVAKPTTLGLTREERELDAAAYALKEGSYYVDGAGRLQQYNDGRLETVVIKSGRSTAGIYPKAERQIKAFIAVRNALRAVITAQSEDAPFEPAQDRLRKAYVAFTSEFGPINLTNTTYTVDPETNEEHSTQRRPNLAPVLDDPDCWLVASIERYEEETQTGKPGPIFTERVVRPVPEPTIETPDDALAATLDTFGHVNIDHIARLLDVSREDAIAQLEDRIYANPENPDEWLTADEYLSGAVRAKLTTARAFAEDDPRFERNVAALEAAQPADLNPSDVTARLGSPWIPTGDIEAFVHEVLDIETKIGHTVGVAAWDVDFNEFKFRPNATSEWGTNRRHAGLLLHDALNGAVPQVYDIEYDGTKEIRQLNPVETEAAREKLEKIKKAFSEWIWQDHDRTTRLMRIYNDTYNDIVPRSFDGSHLQLRGIAANIKPYDHQRRIVWRIIASGSTYLAHSVGAGKTMSIAMAVMEQRRLGLVTKPILTVPGHCLAQFTIEWLQMYPTAKILVADEQNFAKAKRDRFVARATMGDWDCIIITHSAFKFIPSPTEFERAMIEEQVAILDDMILNLKKGPGSGDGRTSRKRLEQRKEALRMRFEELHGRKDDMVTIAEMGIDQIIVDEAQNFRKLSFTTNAGMIKGIDPDGSQRAWDLYVKSRYVATRRPKRNLILSSGTPITNTLGELFTIQRFLSERDLHDRNIHEFDAWKAVFGETVTELELQASGKYKPVTRFAEFINVPELVAMFRSFADVVQRKDLRSLVNVPTIATGARQVVAAEATASFKEYQKTLGDRIDEIEKRHGKAQKGDDIILSVITDGRHAAVDMRLVAPHMESEPTNKLNRLIDNVFQIWQKTSDLVYLDRDGLVSPTPGAVQLIFSDIGTVEVGKTRGFSAYEWIHDRLVMLGVPRREIAFMQDYKKASAKQHLFNEVNAGHVRILIGSSETMGTGVNVQKRLKALHHLDVPWLPSQIEQREGRIERQGNENDEIEIYAYATPGSMDASMWQRNEQKSRFIGMAMSGDKSIRRLEDASSQANSFAIAKAIASGNPLMMQKAGLEADVARLKRLRAAHFDDQHALGNAIAYAKDAIRINTEAIDGLNADAARIRPTRGDDFAMTVFGTDTRERTTAGAYLLGKVTALRRDEVSTVGMLAGFEVVGRAEHNFITGRPGYEYGLRLSDRVIWTGGIEGTAPVGLIQRLENAAYSIPTLLEKAKVALTAAERRLREATPRIGAAFEHSAELDAKIAELARVEAELVEQSRIAEEERRAERAAREATDGATADASSDAGASAEDLAA